MRLRRDGEVGVVSYSQQELISRAREVVEREAAAVAALASQFDERLSQVVEVLLACEGHVLVTGAGTSYAIAQRFAHLLSCSGIPALPISSGDALHGGSGAIRPEDVLYVISKGGQSAEVNQLVDIAKERGAKIVAQTENPASVLAQKSDAVFHVKTVGEVDPFGMVATGSSLVNGAAGDVLCVLLMELRGYTREAFGATHPSGAVGHKLAEQDRVT
jgi:D-arabinose 5-phosphate isomerase GutQ